MYVHYISILTKDLVKKMNSIMVVPFARSEGMDTVFIATTLLQPLWDGMAKGGG
jgi:hypothetical protein